MRRQHGLLGVIVLVFAGLVPAVFCPSQAFAAALDATGSVATGLELQLDGESIGWWTEGAFSLSGSDGATDYSLELRAVSGPQIKDSNLKLDEVSITLYREEASLSVGKKVISWGPAIDINPIDVINPVDPAAPESARQSVWMVEAVHALPGGLEVQGVWMPTFVPAAQTVQHPTAGPLTAPIPPNTWQNSEVGGLVTYRGAGYDVSAMAFSGWEDFPRVDLTPGGPQAEYVRTKAVGAAGITSLGDVGVWVEAAYWVPDEGNEGYQAVVGTDYQTLSGYYFAGQYHVVDRPNLGQKANHLIAAIKRRFGLADQWRVGVVYNLDTDSLAVRPGVDLSLSDSLMLTLEAVVLKENGTGLGLPFVDDGMEVGLTYMF